MGKRILLVQGHPDAGQPHFNKALADFDQALRIVIALLEQGAERWRAA